MLLACMMPLWRKVNLTVLDVLVRMPSIRCGWRKAFGYGELRLVRYCFYYTPQSHKNIIYVLRFFYMPVLYIYLASFYSFITCSYFSFLYICVFQLKVTTICEHVNSKSLFSSSASQPT